MLDHVECDNDIDRACSRFAQNRQDVALFDTRNAKGSRGTYLLWRTIDTSRILVSRLMHDVKECSMPTSKVQDLGVAIAGEVSLNDSAKERETRAKLCDRPRGQGLVTARDVLMIDP